MANAIQFQSGNGVYNVKDATARNDANAIFFKKVDGTVTYGYAVKTQTGELTAGRDYCYTTVVLSDETVIGVSGQDYGSSWRTGCFLDANDSVVSEILVPTEFNKGIYTVDVPTGAKKVLVNGQSNIVGTVYRLYGNYRRITATHRVDNKYKKATAFISESQTLPTSNAASGFADSIFNASIDEGYWGKKELFPPCYVESVKVVRRAEQETNNVVSVILCDDEFTVLAKEMYEGHSEAEVTVPINKYIEKPFYVFIRCVGMGYTVTLNKEEDTITLYANFGTDGYAVIGDTMTTVTQDSNPSLVFNSKITIKSLTEIMANPIDANAFSVVQSPRFDSGTGLSDTLGDYIWGASYKYPAGYIASISLLLKNAVEQNIAVFITDMNFNILKKVFSNTNNKTGVLTIPVAYEATVPVYVFVRCPSCYYDNSGRYFGIRQNYTNLSWGGYGYKTEGEKLFDGNWNNVNSYVLFLYKLNYNNAKRNEFTFPHYERIYTLGDAYRAWVFGEKFPICVIGDSTTDGDTTTGNTPNVVGTDHQDPNTYTSKLQALLRTALNNNVLRIYNAGFSGKGVDFALKTLDDEIWNSQYYSDTKIVVVSHGINDYVTNANAVKWYKDHLAQIVIECFEHGVQPVMMTHQAGMENHGRFAWKQMSIADACTREIAEKFNLELIDKNKLTALFNVYSAMPINTIIPDSCHYSTAGHEFVAGAIFSCLVPTTIFAGEGETIVGFANEQIKTDLEYSSFSGYIWKDVKVITPQNGFKLEAQCSKSAETVLIDAWVFINDKRQKVLKSYCTTPNVQTVIVDDTSHAITQSVQTIGTFDIGLHHVVVKSAASQSVNFLGVKFVD